MGREMDPLTVLQSCALFSQLGEGTLAHLAGIARPRSYEPGSQLFAEAAPAEGLLVIAAGKVRVSTRDPGNVEVLLSELTSGESLGELSVLQPGKHWCTAVATTAVEAVELRHTDFTQLASLKPQPCLKLALAIAGELARRMESSRPTWKGLIAARGARV